MSTEKEFDYQAYMRNLPLGDEDASNRVEIHRGPEARQKRWEAAKARNFQKSITSVAQFHARLEELDSEKKPFLYRGQSNSGQPVNCSAVRRLTEFGTEPIESQLIEPLLVGYLEYLIGKGRRRGFIPSSVGESGTDLELMALLQHQGAATGLIDFTRQPLAALWFACNDAGGKDGAVYVLSHSDVAEIKHRDIQENTIQSFYGENKLWSWEPPVIGNRVVAQSSVFVFGVPTIPSPNMERLTIPAASKNSILSELEAVYGINEEELFPDFPGYAVANSSTRNFAVSRTVEYWKEQIDSASCSGEKALANFRCGVAYSAVQEHAEAIEHYDEAISIDQGFVEAYNYRGVARDALHRHEEAIADFSEAIRINPEYAEAYYNRGIVKSTCGQYEEALADFDKTIDVDPRYAEAYANRGILKNKLGQHEKAISDFDEAIYIDPQLVEAYYGRGNAKFAFGQYHEAIADYDEVLRINPEYVPACDKREIAKEKLRQTSLAE